MFTVCTWHFTNVYVAFHKYGKFWFKAFSSFRCGMKMHKIPLCDADMQNVYVCIWEYSKVDCVFVWGCVSTYQDNLLLVISLPLCLLINHWALITHFLSWYNKNSGSDSCSGSFTLACLSVQSFRELILWD